MRAGDELRFIGPNGAPVLITVGIAFDERTINSLVESGEWTPVDDVDEDQAPAEDVDVILVPPADDASKAVWVKWAVERGARFAEAKAMTKPQLIEAYGGTGEVAEPGDGGDGGEGDLEEADDTDDETQE